MTSVSVKNRAKMFEDLASSNQSDELTPRKSPYQRGGNVLSSSPFLAASSPTRSAASVPYASSFMSSSPKSSVSAPYQQMNRPMSYGGASPRNRNTTTEWERPTQYAGSPRILVQQGEPRDRPFHHQYNGSSPGSRHSPSSWDRPSVYGSSPRTGNSPSDWLGEEEESIPVPSVTRKYQYTDKNRDINSEYSKPVILPSRKPIDVSPFKALQNKDVRSQHHVSSQLQSPVSGSPFKALQNKDHHFKTESPILNKHFIKLQNQTVDHVEVMKSRSKPDTQVLDKKPFVDSEDRSLDRSINSDSENRVPDFDSGKTKSSRALRLMRAKQSGTVLPLPAVDPALKQSLNAAKVVMEEEKSSTGSSNASTRSSLSNKELSNIASRALRMADSTGSVRGTRTLSKVSHQEARRAMLNAAVKRKGKDEERIVDDENEDLDVTERLGAMAKRAVAMKKSSKSPGNEAATRNLEIASSTSNDSNKSRRLEHPAFAARVPPNLKAKTAATKLSSADILTSFRQFNAARSNPVKPKGMFSWSISYHGGCFDKLFVVPNLEISLCVHRIEAHRPRKDSHFESC
jgi:hypothetical protein